MERKKKHGLKILLVTILFLCAFALMTYPFISNYIFEHQAGGIVETIEKTAETADKQKYQAEIERARLYNQKLVDGHIKLKDPFDENMEEENQEEYKSLLNMNDEGIMGFIKIPCIDVSLPIYHGTTEDVLERGAGHLKNTSLPIGGAGTHSVITGHTGLSKAKLFTDLTELEKGDMFFLNVMGEKLAYKVDQISTVLPTEIDKLTVDKDKDYVTLVTCTPYGVNTHRLLVRGTRVDYVEKQEKQAAEMPKKNESKWVEEYLKSIIISAIAYIICMTILLISRYSGRKKKSHKKRILI